MFQATVMGVVETVLTGGEPAWHPSVTLSRSPFLHWTLEGRPGLRPKWVGKDFSLGEWNKLTCMELLLCTKSCTWFSINLWGRKENYLPCYRLGGKGRKKLIYPNSYNCDANQGRTNSRVYLQLVKAVWRTQPDVQFAPLLFPGTQESILRASSLLTLMPCLVKRRPVERFSSAASPSLSFGSAVSGGSTLEHPEVLPRASRMGQTMDVVYVSGSGERDTIPKLGFTVGVWLPLPGIWTEPFSMGELAKQSSPQKEQLWYVS